MSQPNTLVSLIPARDELLEVMRVRLTPELILLMARSDADFSSEVEENLTALNAILRTGDIPGCLPWNPAEICNLHRWQPVTGDKSESLMVVFACWILISAYVQRESLKSGLVDDDDQYAIIALVQHALNLDDAIAAKVAKFLYWAYVSLTDESNHRADARPFYLFGVIAMVGALPDIFSDQEIRELTEHFFAYDDAEVDENSHAFAIPHHQVSDIWRIRFAVAELNDFKHKCSRLVSSAFTTWQTSANTKQAETFGNCLNVLHAALSD